MGKMGITVAVRMWAAADLRARWRSWVLLGLLAGLTFGVFAAGMAGARRTVDAVPRFVDTADMPTAGVLPNDPTFDDATRDAVADLPEVADTRPFLVGIGTEVTEPEGLGDETSPLFPVSPLSDRALAGVLTDGRWPDPERADEVVVDENARDKYHLGLGSTMVVGQSAQTLAALPTELVTNPDSEFSQRLRVVGITKSVSSDRGWTPSSGFYRKYGDRMPGFVNLFVDLKGGERDLALLRSDVEHLVGGPVDVEPATELFGIRKAINVTDVEQAGLMLFAVAALLGGGVLVGQALVRAVTAGAADLPTWRAMGADRSLALRALALPAVVTVAVGMVVTAAVAIGASAWFPIGVARTYELDPGMHADWLVIVVSMAGLAVSTMAVAGLAGWWAVRRRTEGSARPSALVRWTSRLNSPVLIVGSRLAVEPGRGRRAVPVRSAMLGAIVGVMGVVACFTFRNGIETTTSQPERSGVVWDAQVAGSGPVPLETVQKISGDPAVDAVLDARWHRAVSVEGTPVPVFGTDAVKGAMPFVVLDGRGPEAPGEIALAPTTMKELGLAVGDRVSVGSDKSVSVVGEALLPGTSHTDYDQSGWMTNDGVEQASGDPDTAIEDYLLIRWHDDADVAAAQGRMADLAGSDLFFAPAALPATVVDLGRLEALPLALGLFFAVLGCAAVGHALVTGVRRRRHEFAVLRTMGFTTHQSRLSIAWQATLLGAVGVVFGVPLGVVVGRNVWRWLADEFPVLYVPPLTMVAIVLAVPLALLVANLIAAGPAHVVSRVPPAETLRAD